MSGENRYGFDWGPMRVERIAHIPGRGYVVEVRSGEDRDKSVQVLVSEKGQSVSVWPGSKAKIRGR